MVIVLIIVAVAFVWLGYETNWMRERLFIGPYYNRLFKRMYRDVGFLIVKPYIMKYTEL